MSPGYEAYMAAWLAAEALSAGFDAQSGLAGRDRS